MNGAYDIAGLRRRIGAIRTEDNPVLVKQKSRDFYWYSPILKRELDAVTADIVVSPTTEAEVKEVLAAAYEFGIPVTPRGSGTGNYGQAMPLTGGVLLNLADMNRAGSSASPAPSSPTSTRRRQRAGRNFGCFPRRAGPLPSPALSPEARAE